MPKNSKSKSTPSAPPSEPAEGVLMPDAVPDEVFDEVVREIRVLYAASTLEATARMGKLIVDRFYGGAFDRWLEHGDTETSLRKLAKRFEDDALGISPPTILRSVGIYELMQRIDVSAWKQITASHIRAVLNLQEKDQRRLLSMAEERGLSTKALEAEARKVRQKEGERRGRPALPAFVKSIRALNRMTESSEAFADLEQIDDLEPGEATELYQAVTGMKLKCEELQKALEAKTRGFSG